MDTLKIIFVPVLDLLPPPRRASSEFTRKVIRNINVNNKRLDIIVVNVMGFVYIAVIGRTQVRLIVGMYNKNNKMCSDQVAVLMMTIEVVVVMKIIDVVVIMNIIDVPCQFKKQRTNASQMKHSPCLDAVYFETRIDDITSDTIQNSNLTFRVFQSIRVKKKAENSFIYLQENQDVVRKIIYSR